MNITPKEPSGLTQLILSLILMIISGFTIMWMWSWYIVPLGLPAIGLIHAIGIDMLVSFVVTTQINIPPNGGFWERFIYGLLLTCVTLLAGWILHFVM